MRLVDADAYAAELKERQDGCQWRIDNPVGNTFYTEREHWIGVFAAFGEAKITLNNMPTFGAWISVKDRLPRNGEVYLITLNPPGTTPQTMEAYLSRFGDWWRGSVKLKNEYVTHWMPLPDPAKEVSGDDL